MPAYDENGNIIELTNNTGVGGSPTKPSGNWWDDSSSGTQVLPTIYDEAGKPVAHFPHQTRYLEILKRGHHYSRE